MAAGVVPTATVLPSEPLGNDTGSTFAFPEQVTYAVAPEGRRVIARGAVQPAREIAEPAAFDATVIGVRVPLPLATA
jgi:hypothetical protein